MKKKDIILISVLGVIAVGLFAALIITLNGSAFLPADAKSNEVVTNDNTETETSTEEITETPVPESTTTPETTTTEVTTTSVVTTTPETTTTAITTTPETTTTPEPTTTTAVTTQTTTTQTTEQAVIATPQTTAADLNKPAGAIGVDEEGYYYKFENGNKYQWYNGGGLGWDWFLVFEGGGETITFDQSITGTVDGGWAG